MALKAWLDPLLQRQPSCARGAPHPNPLPASGEREGPAEREGEGQYAADSGGFAPDSRELEPVIYARGTEVAAFRSR